MATGGDWRILCADPGNNMLTSLLHRHHLPGEPGPGRTLARALMSKLPLSIVARKCGLLESEFAAPISDVQWNRMPTIGLVCGARMLLAQPHANDPKCL